MRVLIEFDTEGLTGDRNDLQVMAQILRDIARVADMGEYNPDSRVPRAHDVYDPETEQLCGFIRIGQDGLRGPLFLES